MKPYVVVNHLLEIKALVISTQRNMDVLIRIRRMVETIQMTITQQTQPTPMITTAPILMTIPPILMTITPVLQMITIPPTLMTITTVMVEMIIIRNLV